MKHATASDAAAVLRQARASHEPCSLLAEGLRPTSVDQAYDVQDACVTASGEPVAVLKAGLTTHAGLERFGLDQPCSGQIAQSGVHPNGDVIAAALCCQPPILEGEIALRVGADGMPDAAAAAIEVAAFRYIMSEGPSGLDVIADNVGATAVVLGTPVELGQVEDLDAIEIRLSVNGEHRADGVTSNILDGPAGSFARVIAHERDRGREPVPGMWVITGSATGMTPIRFGDSFSASFGALGTLSASVGDRVSD